MLIIGYLVVRPNHKVSGSRPNDYNLILKILIIAVVLSFVLRWIDLFFVRELSFANNPKFNRVINNENVGKSNLLFIVASVLKSLYFFPYVISIKLKHKRFQVIRILSLLCLFLPVLEALLKGTRKPIFEIFFIILITTIIYNRKIITKTRAAVAAISFAILMTISMLVVFQRENFSQSIDTTFYEKILDSRYNEILEPKPQGHYLL